MTDRYDAIPYTAHAYAETHPERLRVVARLSGWQAPELAGARVLELGSGRGGNLLAMAMSLPDAAFVGVERSERQAREARSVAARLGLSRVTVRAESFDGAGLDPEASGTREGYDFVIAHGLASWIAPGARRELLRRIGGWLAPSGVAYVSFNALPGWYARLAARDWLRFEGSGEETAKASLAWLRDAVSPELAGYKGDLTRVLARMDETSPAYVSHEYLEGENHPQRVDELLGEADSAGLAYLGDAIPAATCVETLPPEAQALAGRLAAEGRPDRAQMLVDFVRCAAFRRALFVRRDAAEARAWRWPARLDAGAVEHLLVASRLAGTRDPSLFAGASGSVQVDRAVARRALAALADAAPRALPFAELAGEARGAERSELARELLDLWLSVDGVDLHDHGPPFVTTAGERPEGCPLARWQAAKGEPITNRWHQEVRLEEPVLRAALARADGTKTAAELARAMGTDEAVARASLALLARSALLVR